MTAHVPTCPTGSDFLRRFLLDIRTLAVTAEAEASLAERKEHSDPDKALEHLQESVAAEAALVTLITGPRGRACLRALDQVLRSGVVA